MRIFHIVSAADWRPGAEYRPPSLASEGFIHFSTAAQLVATANRFFAGRRDLLVLEVDPERLGAELRYEAADGQRFPHLYGPLELDAVVSVSALPVDEDGCFAAPPCVAP